MRVAVRYLWSRKSHSAVTAIAIAGVCGVAIATMAIVCVLSVFNGFNSVIVNRDSRIMSDFIVTSHDGDLIANADSLAAMVSKVGGVEAATPVIDDEAVAFYHGSQLPIRLLGVNPADYRRVTDIDSVMISGSWKPQPQEVVDTESLEGSPAEAAEIEDMAAADFDETALFANDILTTEETVDTLPIPTIIVSTGVASNLRLPPAIDTGLMVYLPRRSASSAFVDPSSSFMVDSLAVTGVFASQQAEFDAATVLMDLETARRLLEYDTQSNSLYVKVRAGVNPSSVKVNLTDILGDRYDVRGRDEQQSMHFRMVAIEKWITFLLLAFILLIASFNIISTLSMLIVEKRSNIHTMVNFGASRGFIGRVFFWESIYVCLTGSLTGIGLGVALCSLQQRFGLIRIPGDPSQIIMSYYPVELHFTDLLIVFTLSVAVAFLTGVISSGFARRTALR